MKHSWLETRRRIVGGSEVAALFDDVPEDCPYSSRWQLWAEKRGMLPRRPETDPMKWGKRHEAAITQAAREDWGVDVVDWLDVDRSQFVPAAFVEVIDTDNGFLLVHECGLGGTPDGLISVDDAVWVFERKTVSSWAWQSWGGKLPASYRLQGQVYCGLLDLPGVVYAVLVGGNQLVRFEVEADPRAFAGICAEVSRFWGEVRDGVEPPIRAADYDAVASWYNSLELPDDDKKAKPVPLDTPEAQSWLESFASADVAYQSAKAAYDEAEDARKKALADGMRLFGAHRRVSIAGRTFTRVQVAPKPERMELRKASEGYAYVLAGKVKG